MAGTQQINQILQVFRCLLFARITELLSLYWAATTWYETISNPGVFEFTNPLTDTDLQEFRERFVFHSRT